MDTSGEKQNTRDFIELHTVPRCSAADKDDIIIEKARYQGQLAEYKEFCSAMDLEPEMERVYIDGLGRIAPGRSPITVANRNRNVIMNQARGSGAFQSLNMRTLTSARIFLLVIFKPKWIKVQ